VIKFETNHYEAIISYRTVLIYIDMETISVREFVTFKNIMSRVGQKNFVSNIKLIL
jgi:hypothetical protein